MNDSIASTCLAQHYNCSHHGIRCDISCPWYREMSFQFQLSGIPSSYKNRTVEVLTQERQFVFPKAINKQTDVDIRSVSTLFSQRMPKSGIFMWSTTTGNGKTEMACALANSFIVRKTRLMVNQGLSSSQLVQFVNTVQLFDDIRAGISDDSVRRRTDELVKTILTVPFVIFDDIGAERPSEFVQERFYRLINTIYDSYRQGETTNRFIVFTSNRNLEGIEATLGSRIRSRIDGMTISCEFTGHDRRRKM